MATNINHTEFWPGPCDQGRACAFQGILSPVQEQTLEDGWIATPANMIAAEAQ